ncbi:MAG: EFR1 family ferrodoxin [Kiritimatiellia bacterium]|jgi:Fe-S-cluster-containing hydrogenase component 2/flavodoxin
MTDSANIYYFSGTGNTRLVARLLEREFGNQSVPVCVQRIEDVVNGKVAVPDSGIQMLGIGFPVHGFGPPRLVFDFVERLPRVRGTKVFVFMTAADAFFLNNAASASVSHRLAKKGYAVFHESLIPMPANIAIKYPDSLMKLLCTKAEAEARRLAQEIVEGRSHRFGENAIVRLMARGLNAFEHCGVCLFGKDLTVSSECARCDTCVQECPTRNISKARGKIRFGWKCMACFRCVYACPRRAIMPQLERFIVLKDGYDIEKVFNGPKPLDDVRREEETGGRRKRDEQVLSEMKEYNSRIRSRSEKAGPL